MRHIVLVAMVLALTGCSSVLSQRPPIIEDRVSTSFFKPAAVGTLASAADYRISYVQLDQQTRFCAEAPADAAAQFASTFAAGLDVTKGGATLGANAQVGLAVAMKQLFKRSQGVQMYRDGAFALCNMYVNGGLTSQDYIKEMAALRVSVAELVKTEIPTLHQISVDVINVPDAPNPGQVKTGGASAAPGAASGGASGS